MQTQSLRLAHPDGEMRLYEAVPDGPARGAVIVVQEAFGLNAHIEDVTRRAAGAGFHAVAPDLFHRSGGGTVPYGRDLSKVLPLFDGLDGDDALLRDLDVTLDHLHGAGWADGQIGIVGFCFGGRVSLLAVLRRPLGAGVGFYGGGIVSGRFPQFPPLIDEVPGLTVPWLGLFGDQDHQISVDDVEQVRLALNATTAATDVVRYPDAGHGFHCDRRDDYVEHDARDAWDRTLAWFTTHLA
jgi:carboxymethylenebutenolidase